MRNKVGLTGKIAHDPVLNHTAFGRNFYASELEVKRLSGRVDIIPIIIPEHLVEPIQKNKNCTIKIEGQFRSYRQYEGDKNRLILSVFVWTVCLAGEFDDDIDNNWIFLEGRVCKPPAYRNTPTGKEITDLLLVVNRPRRRSDCIPCIAWGYDACVASELNVGSRVRIYGRIQSREYAKKISEDYSERRTAYEVSIGELEVIENEKRKDQVTDAE